MRIAQYDIQKANEVNLVCVIARDKNPEANVAVPFMAQLSDESDRYKLIATSLSLLQ